MWKPGMTYDDVEKTVLTEVLIHYKGNAHKAVRALKTISKATFYRRLNLYKIDVNKIRQETGGVMPAVTIIRTNNILR